MCKIKSISTIFTIAFVMILHVSFCGTVIAQTPPFSVKKGLFNQAKTDNLGLITAKGTETFTIFKPSETTDKFTNGVVMIAFKDYLYCMWQSSAKNEDAEDTWVAYSRSSDGKNWSEPMVLAASIENGYCSSGGWWATGDTLVGYINTWPKSVSPRGGYTRYTTSSDGIIWSEPKPLLMVNGDTLNGIFEQDPHALPDGRIINAAHFQPGLIISPIYTDDPSGIRGWTRANYKNMSVSGGLSREIEPSWFFRSDDKIVMTFRDQNSTYQCLASVSSDRGKSWTTAVLTDMPDSRSKQSAGNLPDSTAFMVGNPVNNKTRIPLVVTLSRDGQFFNTAYLLREGGNGIQPLKYEGTAKRLGYHYPKSMVYKDFLYVAYSTNKEDAQCTRVPLTSLVLDTSAVNSPTSVFDSPSSIINGNIQIHFSANGNVNISLKDYSSDGIINILNVSGQLLFRSKIYNNELHFNTKQLPAGTYIITVRTNLEVKTQMFQNF